MTRVRIGAQIQPQHAEVDDIRRAVLQAEEMGIDVIYVWDHFFPIHGDDEGKHFECWTLLGAIAEMTHHVDIGPLVTATTYRNPHLLADMARTVDQLSGGRLVLGVGAGWFEKDHREYGYPFGTAGSRLALLEEALPAIRRRLGRLNPPPRRRIPILVGGQGERRTLALVAEHADVWHTFADDVEAYLHKATALDEWCRRIGRDPAQISRSVGLRDRPEEPPSWLTEAGITEITLGFAGPDYDLAPLAPWLEWRDGLGPAAPSSPRPAWDGGRPGGRRPAGRPSRSARTR